MMCIDPSSASSLSTICITLLPSVYCNQLISFTPTHTHIHVYTVHLFLFPNIIRESSILSWVPLGIEPCTIAECCKREHRGRQLIPVERRPSVNFGKPKPCQQMKESRPAVIIAKWAISQSRNTFLFVYIRSEGTKRDGTSRDRGSDMNKRGWLGWMGFRSLDFSDLVLFASVFAKIRKYSMVIVVDGFAEDKEEDTNLDFSMGYLGIRHRSSKVQ